MRPAKAPEGWRSPKPGGMGGVSGLAKRLGRQQSPAAIVEDETRESARGLAQSKTWRYGWLSGLAKRLGLRQPPAAFLRKTS
jgi:hypothetical protein